MSALHVNAAPSAPLDAMQVAALAEYCLGATGPARVRLIGQEVGDLAAPLRSAGCQVIEASCGEALTPDDGVVIAWAHDNDARAGILRLDVTVAMLVGPAQAASEASAWLVQASVSGWDLHPAVFAMMEVPEGLQVLMFTRRGVDAALENDAQCASFHGLAAALVRPGDVVLATDAAQGGLWRIVWQQSRCAWLGLLTDQPPPTGLEHGVHWLDEQAWRDSPTPLDVVITRLPHGSSDWAHGLRRASSALIRSGRLVIQVPLESGHIVHDGSLLALLEECGLVVDRAWWQIRSVPHGLRQFTEVERDDHERLAIEAGLSDAADAWVLLAVKTEGRGVVQVPDLDAPNIIAFQRDYLDASVVRLIVAIGLRLESAVLRRDLARRTMQEVPEASADYGAALCVLLYDPVTLSGGGREELIAAAHRYIVLPAINPTMLRWQVSLAFAVAGLQQSSGDLLQAAALYEQVLGFDVLAFSALLGTKTTTAAARLGWIRFGAGDVAGARQAWARGLEEARRLSLHTAWSEVIGDPDAPETFAMPEFAAVMDEAGCLASALRVTAESPLRPGTAWQWANRSWRMQLETARLMQLSRQRWYDQLQDAKDWLDGQYHQLTAELERHKAAVHVLESDKHVLEAEMTGLRAAFGLAHRHAASQLAKQTRAIQALESEQRVSVVEMNGLRAAFELAHRRAAAEKVALQQQLHDAQADYVQLSAAHSQLQSAARNLTAATGAILHTVPQTRLPAESIAEEMSRLAAALNRLPLKRLVWAALRGLASLLGRR